MASTSAEGVRHHHPRSRRLVRGVLVLLLIVVGIVYAGTFLQARAAFPSCSRTLAGDDSVIQHGHSSMRLAPPRVRCSYSTDTFHGVPAEHEDHWAIFGIAVVGLSSVFIVPALLLEGGWGDREDLPPSRRRS